jgi:hypothetical protein
LLFCKVARERGAEANIWPYDGGSKRHNEGLHNLYFSSDVISEVELGGPDGVQKHDTLWGEKNEGWRKERA